LVSFQVKCILRVPTLKDKVMDVCLELSKSWVPCLAIGGAFTRWLGVRERKRERKQGAEPSENMSDDNLQSGKINDANVDDIELETNQCGWNDSL